MPFPRTLMILLACVPGWCVAQQNEVLFSHQFELGASQLSPGLVYVRAGTTSQGIAGPLQIELQAPAGADTFVPITSLAPSRLTIPGGGVTVLAGQSTALVSLTGVASDPQPVLVRASLGNQVYASVRVFDDSDPRQVVSLRPNPISIAPGGQRDVIATLDLPGASTGTPVDLTVAPVMAGSFTTPLVVPADTFSQSFTYTDADITETATLSAAVAMTPPAQANIVQSPVGKLVINEVDYDQPAGDDTAEFVEIYNRSPDNVALAGISLMFINGSQSPSPTYLEVALSDVTPQLSPGQYLVVAQSSVVVPPGTPFIAFEATENSIQNGGPDGIAIVDTEALAVIDALSYEGSVSQAQLPGFPGTVSLVEGTATAAVDGNMNDESLSRLPNGTDNNNASTDFAVTAVLTPGASNDGVSGHLVINEVDYDQTGTDSASYIEIFNPTASSVSLDAIDVVLVNGTGSVEYARFPLSGGLAPGGYAVVGNSAVVSALPPGVLAFTAAGDFIQNGAPDGIALINTDTASVIDVLSYEGLITAAAITGIAGTVSLVEGTAFSGADTNDNLNALARQPNGADTDNAASDWALVQVFTPGAANPP